MPREDFTTHQVCRMLGIARRSLILWIEQGKLTIYKTPGGHRRIRRQDLLAFLHRQGMPVPAMIFDLNDRVMIIEDDPMSRKLMAKIACISEEGRFHVRTAHSGYEGLLQIGIFHPSILVLDIKMPTLDGFEVCRHIRRIEELRSMRILACSSMSAEECEVEVLEAGADAFVEKPFTLAKFNEFVHKCRTGNLTPLGKLIDLQTEDATASR